MQFILGILTIDHVHIDALNQEFSIPEELLEEMSSSFPEKETGFTENEVSDNNYSLLINRPPFDVTESDTQG